MGARKRVLVTGGAGFLASHIIFQLLEKGYEIRTTTRASEVSNHGLEFLKTMHPRGHSVEVFYADLLESTGWSDAVKGCQQVYHVASPFSTRLRSSYMVRAATLGTRHVMEAVVEHKDAVEKVVMTSSICAVSYGHDRREYDRPMDESYWTVKNNVNGYELSKLEAEKIAWDICNRHQIPLNTICPALIVGPVLSPHQINCESSYIMTLLLNNGLMVGLDIALPLTDVRDVATLHIKAMEIGIQGERFISVSDDGKATSMDTLNDILREHFSQESRYSPATITFPNGLLRVACSFIPKLYSKKSLVGTRAQVSNEKAKTCLGMTFRSAHQAVLDHVHSLFKHCDVPTKGYPKHLYINFQPYP